MRIADQREFGEAAGIEQSLYNRFETGKRPGEHSSSLWIWEKADISDHRAEPA
jgi:hypothetical protein